MSEEKKVAEQDVGRLYARLDQEAERGGYHLNPDTAFTRDLVRGLIVNERRYGYWACPCRLASGEKAEDLDIICPCDYRDADVLDYGACFCALYVSEAVVKGKREVASIPDRRPPEEERKKDRAKDLVFGATTKSIPVWRCKVCGYLCARDGPPEVCPICKAKKDRFERFV